MIDLGWLSQLPRDKILMHNGLLKKNRCRGRFGNAHAMLCPSEATLLLVVLGSLAMPARAALVPSTEYPDGNPASWQILWADQLLDTILVAGELTICGETQKNQPRWTKLRGGLLACIVVGRNDLVIEV